MEGVSSICSKAVTFFWHLQDREICTFGFLCDKLHFFPSLNLKREKRYSTDVSLFETLTLWPFSVWILIIRQKLWSPHPPVWVLVVGEHFLQSSDWHTPVQHKHAQRQICRNILRKKTHTVWSLRDVWKLSVSKVLLGNVSDCRFLLWTFKII